MARLRRTKSLNDISEQYERIADGSMDNFARRQRALRIATRYSQNIGRTSQYQRDANDITRAYLNKNAYGVRQGMNRQDNRQYSRNVYMGVAKGGNAG